MPPDSRRRAASGIALGLAVVLLVVALQSGTAHATGIAANASAKPKVIDFSTVWHGTAKSRPKVAPDVMILPEVPAGTWWEITKVQLTGNFPNAKSFRQTSFLYTRFVADYKAYPKLADPNLDSLSHLGLNPGKTGTFVGAGGVGKSPNPTWDWIQFEQPITLTSMIQIVLGSSLGVGNTVTVTVDYVSLGPGSFAVGYGHPSLDGKTQTFKIGPAPAGTKWYIENAFAYLIASTNAGGREVKIVIEQTGTVLLKGTSFAKGVKVRETGGYSSTQTGPALTQYGMEVVWTTPLWLTGSEYIVVTFSGTLASDSAMYAVGFTQVSS